MTGQSRGLLANTLGVLAILMAPVMALGLLLKGLGGGQEAMSLFNASGVAGIVFAVSAIVLGVRSGAAAPIMLGSIAILPGALWILFHVATSDRARAALEEPWRQACAQEAVSFESGPVVTEGVWFHLEGQSLHSSKIVRMLVTQRFGFVEAPVDSVTALSVRPIPGTGPVVRFSLAPAGDRACDVAHEMLDRPMFPRSQYRSLDIPRDYCLALTRIDAPSADIAMESREVKSSAGLPGHQTRIVDRRSGKTLAEHTGFSNRGQSPGARCYLFDPPAPGNAPKYPLIENLLVSADAWSETIVVLPDESASAVVDVEAALLSRETVDADLTYGEFHANYRSPGESLRGSAYSDYRRMQLRTPELWLSAPLPNGHSGDVQWVIKDGDRWVTVSGIALQKEKSAPVWIVTYSAEGQIVSQVRATLPAIAWSGEWFGLPYEKVVRSGRSLELTVADFAGVIPPSKYDSRPVRLASRIVISVPEVFP
jgi:hypothetical protein